MNPIQKLLLYVLALTILGCGAYKAKKQEALLNLPLMGTLVKTTGDMSYNAAEQIGIPKWTSLKVEVKELPFNIESYTTYARHMHRAAKINSIPYNDSLRYKPKYIRLQVQNKIDIAHMLNDDAHGEMRDYLSLDPDHRLVTSVDLALTELEIQEFLAINGAALKKDKLNNIVLVLYMDDVERTYQLKDLPIFDYGLSAFCWGEDQYHRLRIENIVDEDLKCPRNTYLKASKIKSDKAYLKF
ncbi:hypothetical protein MTsPCn5_16520 [Croceitalea sp. MTPC5]|uniref:hypothetical protein n=1 Tax=Croceitalea sp. MTPC5 TaxID=3056565 RepID=UPI002B37187D|nr:hypothetical protein MTsPCn5_16520 [Croceitalea sp. MTPC5]